MVCATADEHTTAETAALVRTAKSFNRAIMDYATALLRTPGGVAPYPPNFRSTPVAIRKIVRNPTRTTSWSSAIRMRVIRVPELRLEGPIWRHDVRPILRDSTC